MTANVENRSYLKSALFMDTVVTIKIVASQSETMVEEGFTRAFSAFAYVQQTCNRFDPTSELSRLSQQVDIPVSVSTLLFAALRFAREVADSTAGVFDPTLGYMLEKYGFNRNYLTRTAMGLPLEAETGSSYRDIELNAKDQTVLLRRPLRLDLGAVAKGLAVDLAAKELALFEGFAVDAGGDIYVKGTNEHGEPWTIGIRHPLQQEEIICSLKLTNAAVCTSGSYERRSPLCAGVHHLIDPRTKASPNLALSSSVIAPFAMLADAFSTTAFLLGPEQGLAKLEENGLDGLLITPSLDIPMTKEMQRYLI